MEKKKIVVLIMIVSILVLFAYLIIQNQKYSELSNEVLELNKYCPEDTLCAPFKPECGHWRVTSYAPYKYCSIKGIDKEQCKNIEDKGWAAYCMALKASDEECLEFVSDDRELQAVCHINETGQLLFPRETGDPGVYVNENNEIIEDFKFYIMTNCSDMIGYTCNVLVWEEK